jgi:hypothetical protein
MVSSTLEAWNVISWFPAFAFTWNSYRDTPADELLFRECGRIAGRAAHTIKRALRRSNALMGAKVRSAYRRGKGGEGGGAPCFLVAANTCLLRIHHPEEVEARRLAALYVR